MVLIVLVVTAMLFRTHMFKLNMGNTPTTVSEEDYRELGRRTEGYSGSDISIVVRDALMQVIHPSITRLLIFILSASEKGSDCHTLQEGVWTKQG
jgi:SpoVK/Ycf46/Vps4 family AAA+-type ATPase